MFDWLKDFVLSRYMKSLIRYAIAALIGGLLMGAGVPGMPELAAFLELHTETLTEILALILSGLLATWSVAKNRINAKIDKKIIGAKVR